MTEFSSSASLNVQVNSNSLRNARQEIQNELGGVTVDVNQSGRGLTGGGGASQSIADGGIGLGQAGLMEQLGDLADERNTLLHEIRDFAERGALQGGGGDGGSSLLSLGLLTSLSGISASALIAGGATITAGALIAGGATIVAADLIQSPADVKPSSLIAGGAAISAGALIASSATITPAALIAGAATISAGVLVSESATVQASALIGSAAVIGAGVLIGSTATIVAGSLIASAAVIKSTDIIAGKISKSELLDTFTNNEQDTPGNPDRTKPDVYGPNNRPTYQDISTFSNFGGDMDDYVPELNFTGDVDPSEINTPSDLETPEWYTPENSTDTNSTSTTSSTESGNQTRTNQARESTSPTVTIESSPTYNVDISKLERQHRQHIRDLKRRIKKLEDALERAGGM